MPHTMNTIRLLGLNVYYHVVSGLATNWSTTKVIFNAPKSAEFIKIPTVAVVPDIVNFSPFEIGTDDDISENYYNLQCYADRDGQRDDLGEAVKDLFNETKRDFLDYNDGFPPVGGQSILGRINFEVITMNPVKVLGSPHPAEKHRMDIRMSAEIIGL